MRDAQIGEYLQVIALDKCVGNIMVGIVKREDNNKLKESQNKYFLIFYEIVIE